LNNKNKQIYILNALRSPIGKLNGALSHIRPDDLGALLIKALLDRVDLSPSVVERVIVGCANQAGEDNRNLARMMSLLADLPFSTTALTVNSLCSSGMEAIFMGIRSILLGECEVAIVGGIESMSRSPLVRSKVDGEEADSLIGWRFVNDKIYDRCPPLSMPETAERLAKQYNISQQVQDRFAFESRQKYAQAKEKGIWQDELFPIRDSKGKEWLVDEQHRLLSLDLLAKLPKLVAEGQCITSANAARVGDGGALLLLASSDFVERHQLLPLCKVNHWASAACHPSQMGLSAVAATQQLLRGTTIPLSAIQHIELSEAFAVQVLACRQELGIDSQHINPYGGALSMGNPIGMGAARLVVTLAHALHRQKDLPYGLATTCAGLGVGSALLLEA